MINYKNALLNNNDKVVKFLMVTDEVILKLALQQLNEVEQIV